jgi:hypothetical protein
MSELESVIDELAVPVVVKRSVHASPQAASAWRVTYQT